MGSLDQMLLDIRRETTLTRAYTGLDRLEPRVLEAMSRVPRPAFVPAQAQELAFRNGPLPIGHGQTISQPFIVALMTHLLAPQPRHVILEVGTGSGYQAAVLSLLAAKVHSMEIIPELASAAAARLAELGYGNVEVRQGDAYAGLPEQAPFDGIMVTAAAPHIPPALIEQLRPGGRLVIPVGRTGWSQTLKLIRKDPAGRVSERDVLDVAFVPLTGGHE